MSDEKRDAHPSSFALWSLVSVGILSISVASILIRMADAPSLSIATYRVSLAVVFLTPYFFLWHDRRQDRWDRKILQFTLLSGAFLAFHFMFWIHSLKLTSVASSVTLVSTTPLFVAVFSSFWLHEKPTRQVIWGSLITLIGSVLIAGTDFTFSKEALQGDLFAILGALMATGYLLSGRFVRRSLGLTAYIFAVYGVAALVLLICCLLTGTPVTGFSKETYLVLILLAIIPQLIGHTTFNWALKFLSATVVAVLILGEPIGATILAFLFLGESVSGIKAIGLITLGTGILLCSLAIAPAKRLSK
ncbi:MAG: DMT family transporter [Desulfoferrobacter sp.]